jgi:hypothetical protein
MRVLIREVAAETADTPDAQDDEYNRVVRLLGC